MVTRCRSLRKIRLLVVVACLFSLVGLAAFAHAEPAGSFTIPAWAFDRGNAKTFTTQYADGGPMVAFGGVSPVVIEYDLELPVEATWTLSIRYAAATSRPIELWLDGKKLGNTCNNTTGSWDTSSAQWEESVSLSIPSGKHTVKLVRDGSFPHVTDLKFDSTTPFPKDWKLKRPKARKLTSPPPISINSGGNPTAANIDAIRLAIEDLIATNGQTYANGPKYLERLNVLDAEIKRLESDANQGEPGSKEAIEKVLASLDVLRREALLANPLLNFERLMLVKRGSKSPSLGLPRNWQSNSSLPKSGFDDEIAVLSPVGLNGEMTTFYRPEKSVFVGDVDLNFDGDRLLFSSVGSHNRWQVFEIRSDGTGLRELTGTEPDVDCYDACYLPDGKIMITSTAYFVGVPCVYGSSHVSVLYVMDADGKNIRQLCFDQEHDWCPTVLNNGRVMYLRWEYTDTPHSNTRILFHMNPDGTEQMEYYGSNSYWPNSTFYARAVPGHPTKVVGVIGGHHDNPRMGELVVFDPLRGRREASGAVQRIPGHGRKVEPIISDGLTKSSWPKFLHPYPLSEKYFLVSSRPTPQSQWGIYLVDVFDNMVLIKETPGYALLEPTPLRQTPRPPVIPEKVNLKKKDAVVYIPDVYSGPGLRDIPRGKVKQLRIFSYHFAYQGMGGLLSVVGADGPWDMKRVVGTVPVREDGSVKFRMPANLPVSLQPLDEEGKALQLMRSWMTAMPGEVVQCAGCHESQNSAPATQSTLSLNTRPVEIEPWYGPMRGFNYAREVQPVVDRYCLGCHDGQPGKDGNTPCDLRGDVRVTDYRSITPGNGGGHGGKFSVGYVEMCRYVRRPGIESDYHMLEPMEYHADSTQLVQMLKKGHHGVSLDREAWDRLVTWIDLNCPFHGTWGEELAKPGIQRERRRELLKLYANIDDDPEAVPEVSTTPIEPIAPAPQTPVAETPTCPNWPLATEEAVRRQQAAGTVTRRTIELAEGATMEMVLIPAGEFVMGSRDGESDERPQCRVRIERPFWIGTCEVTNEQFRLFAPEHDSRVESKNAYQFGIHGYPMNEPWQPVVRVTWASANAFCQWLSEKSGEQFSLPTEAQWEYACRAGTDSPFSHGDLDTDFSTFANLSDAKMTEFASNPYTVNTPLKNPPKHDDWIPKDSRFNDGSLLSVKPGSYQPNPWGLFDMHGNVAEWTRTTYRPYPFDPTDGRDSGTHDGRKVVRGGSWRDRPMRATSAFRLSFQPYQRVYNVGFRVVVDTIPETVASNPR